MTAAILAGRGAAVLARAAQSRNADRRCAHRHLAARDRHGGLILFMLWHPALSVATLKPQQNVVAVLVDNSRSMCIADASGTREAAAKALLDQGLLQSLSDRFQVRLYEFGKEPARIQNTGQLNASAPASRIGDTLERVLAESSSLPLGRHRAAERRRG